MTLDISGYNDNFKAFVEFAQQRKNANDANAVIDAHENTLGGRKILAVTQSVTDEVHKWTRSTDENRVNDNTRALFLKAVIDMFGSEKLIPESVRKAMRLSDYNCGKPLHAEKMYSDDAKNFADFIVNLTKSGAAQDQWDALVEKIVKNIDALRP